MSVACAYDQRSFFKVIFDPSRDFNYAHVHEMTEEMQIEHDPVGFYYFLKPVVYGLLAELRTINKRRVTLRDLLHEMDRIWRVNDGQRRVLNEPDYKDKQDVARRVIDMIQITRSKLGLQERSENVATGDTAKHRENVRPLMHPVSSNEKQSGVMRITTPHIDKMETQGAWAARGTPDHQQAPGHPPRSTTRDGPHLARERRTTARPKRTRLQRQARRGETCHRHDSDHAK